MLLALSLPPALAFLPPAGTTSTPAASMAPAGGEEGVGSANENPSFPDGVTGVTLKMAFDSSPAWAVADLAEVQSERFTCDASLDLVHRLRRISDCVLVGRSTVEQDDCTLTVRRVPLLEGRGQPVRVVIDPTLRVMKPPELGEAGGGSGADAGYAMLRDGLPAVIYHSGRSVQPGSPPVSDAVTLVDLSSSHPPKHEGGKRFCDFIAPSAVLSDLAARGIQHVMVEGGPATALAFLNGKTVDRAIIIRAPVSFGVPVHSDISEKVLERAGLKEIGTRPCGEDVVHYWTRPGMPWPTEDLMDWP